MTQRFHREALWVARGFGPLRSGVAVRAERNALDAKSAATLLEFGCPISGAQVAQIWKQRPSGRQSSEHRLDLIAEAEQSGLAGLPALVADHAIGPVGVVGGQIGNVGLPRAKVPGQFVAGFSFGIPLPGYGGLEMPAERIARRRKLADKCATE